MTYLQRNKKQSKKTKILIAIIIVFVLFRIFNIQTIERIFNPIFNSILESKSSIFAPIQNTVGYFESKDVLEAENRQFKKENTDLKLNLLITQIANQEFDLFRKQFIDEDLDKKVFKVILKPPFMPFDFIRASGDFSNYNTGDLVFYQNVVIGTIAEKSGSFATVELFSTPEKIIPAVVKGTQFEAKGLGGGRYVLETSKDFDVTEGEAIAYPFEKIVLLGVVGQIETSESELFKKVYFNIPVTLDSISYITVGM